MDRSKQPLERCIASLERHNRMLTAGTVALAALGLLAAAGGCASTYVAPTEDGATASLSFQVSGNPTVGYAAYLLKRDSLTDHRCVRNPQKIAQIAVGVPLLKTRNPERIAMPAGKALYLRAMYVPAQIFGQTACSFDLSFTPAGGKAYRIQIDWTQNSCAVEIFYYDNGTWLAMQADTLQKAC